MANNDYSWTEMQVEETKNKIMTALEQVIDPELGIDIVNLGLVYGAEFFPGGHCVVQMTLTTMGCPLADVIVDEVERALKSVPEITSSEVDIVWYPAWEPAKMSRYARIALGIR